MFANCLGGERLPRGCGVGDGGCCGCLLVAGQLRPLDGAGSGWFCEMTMTMKKKKKLMLLVPVLIALGGGSTGAIGPRVPALFRARVEQLPVPTTGLPGETAAAAAAAAVGRSTLLVKVLVWLVVAARRQPIAVAQSLR